MFCLALQAQDSTNAAARLKKDHPKIQWNAATATKVDIDCDGKPDTFYWGIDPEVEHTYYIHGKNEKYIYAEIAFGFEFGNNTKTQTLNVPFFKNTGYYGFRTEPNKIDVQPLSCDWEGGAIPGCAKNDRCESMWIRDGKGFEGYVFWDSDRKQVSWIRH